MRVKVHSSEDRQTVFWTVRAAGDLGVSPGCWTIVARSGDVLGWRAGYCPSL